MPATVKIRAIDEAPRGAYTIEKIGEKRERTPDGFLICRDVPLARIGQQEYGPTETPIRPRPGSDRVYIERHPDEVFRPETLASAIGKPFVIQHPDDMTVSPMTFRQVVSGHVMNARRGEGEDADVILGDLFIGDREAIDLIDAGMREVSMGYNCAYDEVGDENSGVGRQRDIIFNHVALVDQGRCGPRCAIGDELSTTELNAMAKPTNDRRTVIDRIRSLGDRLYKAGKTGDEKEKAAVEKELEEVGDDAEEGHHIEVHNHLPGGEKTSGAGDADPNERMDKLEKKVDDGFKKIGDALTKLGDARAKDKDDEEAKKAEDEKILGELEMEAPAGAGDKARKAADSMFLDDSYQRTVASAEILAPGIRVPTFDSKAAPIKTFRSICDLRRSALDLAYVQPDTRGMIDVAMNGRALDTKTMTCADTRTVFNSVAAMKKQANNNDNAHGGGSVRVADLRGTGPSGTIRTQADLNAMADKMYGRTNGQRVPERVTT